MTQSGYSAWYPVLYILFLNLQRMKAEIHFPDFFECMNLDTTSVASVRLPHRREWKYGRAPLLPRGFNLDSLFLNPHIVIELHRFSWQHPKSSLCSLNRVAYII